ncbi:MAG: amino acid permease [Deltaproteobacteria bacterium]
MSDTPTDSDLKRQLGLFSATILVVANMVGTGIFTTPGFVIRELGTPFTMLLCWIVGGVFALSGALCYGELGAAYPEAGGEYVYLREGFGKWLGFLSGWTSLIVGFSAPIAAASMAFAAYAFDTMSIAPGPLVSLTLFGVPIASLSALTVVATGTIVILSGVHSYSLLFGARVQNALTVFKIAIILAFVIAGFTMGRGSTFHFSGGISFESLYEGNFAIALIFVSFAYSGWNAAAYLGSEIRRPGINIPLALFIGTSLVMALYLILNIVYIYALPAREMSGVIEVGAKSAAALFGPGIGAYFSGAIAFALLSVLSAMIMAGPRIYYAMSKDRVFFRLFGSVSEARKTPGYSILLQGAIAVGMVITASFDKLLLYIGFTLSLFTMLAVVSLMRLRVTRPREEGGYRTFGYPVTPLVFILGNLWIIYWTVNSRPVTAFWGLATIGAGAVVYRFFRSSQRPDTADGTGSSG